MVVFGQPFSDSLMFWGMREDRQHLAMSLHCPTTSQPRLAGFWLILCMTRLCPSCHGKFTLCHHLGGAHVGTALQKRSSVSTQIFAFFGGGVGNGGGSGIKLATCTQERWERVERFHCSARESFLIYFFPALCMNCTVIFCCWKVALLHRQTSSNASQT